MCPPWPSSAENDTVRIGDGRWVRLVSVARKVPVYGSAVAKYLRKSQDKAPHCLSTEQTSRTPVRFGQAVLKTAGYWSADVEVRKLPGYGSADGGVRKMPEHEPTGGWLVLIAI
ncbi:hypothetical protein Y032_0026g1451 [Ancylostoma ceylanicum]|uniref:Uncharacterized protein n=1 Tax=Ancylostoma ceylanicum TaxID=53326 RepID=A0A016UUQ3_9BILA|nr:hypothetical protein Y032_0026g1451 [Ancylostoma ceylanicum]